MRIFTFAVDVIIRIVFGGVRYAQHKGVRVGNNCRIYTNRLGSEPFLITIGNRVTVTSGVSFVTHDGGTWLMRDSRGRRYTYGRIEIGDDVFIGVNATIMPSVRIGSRVIVAAGAVVTRSIPSGAIVAGVPARVIGRFDDYERKALTSFKSEADLNGVVDYRARVDIALQPGFKPELPFDHTPH